MTSGEKYRQQKRLYRLANKDKIAEYESRRNELRRNGTYTMRARKGGIMVIDGDDTEELDLSMTLIAGMRSKTGLIIASDSLAGHNRPGTPIEKISNIEKIKIVSSTVLYGYTGSMVNWNTKLQAIISTLLQQNPQAPLVDMANSVAAVLPQLYADRLNHPDFFLALILAGYSQEKTEPQMLVIHRPEGSQHWGVGSWDDVQPWTCIGTENNRSDAFIKTRYKGKPLSQKDTIQLLKSAIDDTAVAYPDEVGGPTHIYKVIPTGITRLE